MKEIDIFGENWCGAFTGTRAGSRAVILREGKILLSHESLNDLWLLPGGGMEAGESPEACCVREAEEETGLLVRPEKEFLRLNEYYEAWRYISHYFVCRVAGSGRMALTETEKARGARPEWLPLEEALAIFSRHRDYAAEHEEKRGIYFREFTALTEYCQQCDQEQL